jgi:hypothetical protein
LGENKTKPKYNIDQFIYHFPKAPLKKREMQLLDYVKFGFDFTSKFGRLINTFTVFLLKTKFYRAQKKQLFLRMFKKNVAAQNPKKVQVDSFFLTMIVELP